ncbi:MAG TPA: lactate racemase domain-containing protein [Chloroflexota bacterium]|nr:lactate racemase domain-containing protein [Chloroflexota bacterium]
MVETIASARAERRTSPDLPLMARVRQRLYDRVLIDIEGTVIRQVDEQLRGKIRPGQSIAVAIGSRGVANIARIARATAEGLRRLGGEPFIVPAMGSHGGATAEGQVEVLASLGVTEAFVGCPIRSSMEVVQLGETDDGMPAYLDRNAASADGIVVINRVKKHTDFHGEIESGLLKMICIGLGKKSQADLVHAYGAPGLRYHVPRVARVTLARAPILLGIATLENGYEETAEIVAFRPAEIEAGEKRLLRKNKRHYPMLPLDEIDVLIVDRMGKDVSGTGLDTNVIGRIRIAGEPEPPKPSIRMLVALSLTEASHGNAVGVGLADVISQRLRDQIDDTAMAVNVVTSGFLERGKIPITLPNDRLAIETALSRLPPEVRRKPRIVRILDTLHVAEFDASEALIEELAAKPSVTVAPDRHPIYFDAIGTICQYELGEAGSQRNGSHTSPPSLNELAKI